MTSTVTINLDQHKLVKHIDGTIVRSNDPEDVGIIIYDSLGETYIVIPETEEVVNFLEQVEPLVISFSEAVQPGEKAPNISTADAMSQGTSSSSQCHEIWVKNSGKPSPEDLRARGCLIELIKSDKFHEKLNDKKSAKKKVWSEIGQAMQEHGFNFGDRDPGTVCAQKWRNLEKGTLNVIAAGGPKNSGGGKVKVPDYYEEVHDVIKDSAKAHPVNLIDTLEPIPKNVPSRKEDDKIEEEEDDNGETSKSPFLKVLKSSKPKKRKCDSSEILTYLKEESSRRDAQNTQMMTLMERKINEDSVNKKALLDVMAKLLEK